MKKKSYFFKLKKPYKQAMFVLALLVSSSLVAQDVTTGLQLRYSFDAVTGTSITDDSGNSNTGTTLGAPTVTTGNPGNALTFPLVTDYMQLPNTITTSLTDFTVATWVKVNTAAGWSRIFDFGAGTATYMFLTPHAGSATGAVRYAIKYNNSAEQVINGTSGLATGSWVHVAVTQQGTTGTLYVNGVVVGTNTAMTLNPASLGALTQNYIAKSQWPDPTLAGSIDEFRIYNRALTAADIVALTGLNELKTQQTALNLGDISTVTSKLTLPTTMGTQGVKVRWVSSNPGMIDTLGNVVRPNKYNTPVQLTATLSQTVNGVIYTLTKDFTATVTATNPVLSSELVANWNFAPANIFMEGDTVRVKDASESGFVGKIMDVARIRTIGNTTKYNVLDLGSNKGYFDMGAGIGEAIYSLNDYTIGGYYRVDSAYTNLNSWGNLLYSFSNSVDVLASHNGTMYAGLKNQNAALSPGSWNNGSEQGIGINVNATKNGWHHFAYTQNGNVGTIYVDGVTATTGSVTWHPFNTLRQNGLTGTPYNFIGHPVYVSGGDVYLQKTLVYGLQVYNVALSADDMSSFLGVTDTIASLNNAYKENADNLLPELSTETNNLSLGNISAVTSDITLPSKGNLDQSIIISWKSSHNEIINSTGVVTSPNYNSYNVTLTATLTKSGQSQSKTFIATVLPKAGSTFTNSLLVKYDFSSVTNDSIVTDAAEKHLTGVLKNQARVHTIGSTDTGKYNVLALGDSIGYFDMGIEVGKLVYGLKDYTVGAFYRIDASYTNLATNGNFLWAFSNATNILTDPSGYLIGSLKNQAVTISQDKWTGEQTVSLAMAALLGGWHHFAYVQSGTIGTIYVDGLAISMGEVTKLPSTTLAMDQRLGTLYNWIGRSNYSTDAYLRKTLIADFRLYNTALTDEQIQMTELDISNKISELDVAYSVNDGTPVRNVNQNQYKVITQNGQITIKGLTGSEKVSIFDLTGHQFKLQTSSSITVKTGVYIVKINETTTKVVVM